MGSLSNDCAFRCWTCLISVVFLSKLSRMRLSKDPDLSFAVLLFGGTNPCHLRGPENDWHRTASFRPTEQKMHWVLSAGWACLHVASFHHCGRLYSNIMTVMFQYGRPPGYPNMEQGEVEFDHSAYRPIEEIFATEKLGCMHKLLKLWVASQISFERIQPALDPRSMDTGVLTPGERGVK